MLGIYRDARRVNDGFHIILKTSTKHVGVDQKVRLQSKKFPCFRSVKILDTPDFGSKMINDVGVFQGVPGKPPIASHSPGEPWP